VTDRLLLLPISLCLYICTYTYTQYELQNEALQQNLQELEGKKKDLESAMTDLRAQLGHLRSLKEKRDGEKVEEGGDLEGEESSQGDHGPSRTRETESARGAGAEWEQDSLGQEILEKELEIEELAK